MRPNIPVLAYHKIAEPSSYDANPNTCVAPAAFETQMRLLRLAGYATPAPGEYLKARLGAPADLPPKPVLITFDDAFESVLTRALPVLRKNGFSAAVFMVASAFGGSAFWDGESRESPNRLLDAAGLKELLGAGWTIGSHGVTHSDFRRLPAAGMAEEASRSKTALESALGSAVAWFAYPYGGYTEEAKRAVSGAGYELAFATEKGDGGAFAVPRRVISGKSGVFNFALRLRQAAGMSAL